MASDDRECNIVTGSRRAEKGTMTVTDDRDCDCDRDPDHYCDSDRVGD